MMYSINIKAQTSMFNPSFISYHNIHVKENQFESCPTGDTTYSNSFNIKQYGIT